MSKVTSSLGGLWAAPLVRYIVLSSKTTSRAVRADAREDSFDWEEDGSRLLSLSLSLFLSPFLLRPRRFLCRGVTERRLCGV